MPEKSEKSPILLIQPKTGSWDVMGARLPQGLLSIAALPHMHGYPVKIFDQRMEQDWQKRLLEVLAQKPIVVAMSVMTGKQIQYALEVSQFVKDHSSAKIVWGGIHPTLFPDQTIAHRLIDMVLMHDGEFSFLELIHALEKGGSLKNIKGLCWKDKGVSVKNPERPFANDLEQIPELPYNLVDMNKYYGLNLTGQRSMVVTTSRGCPYRCTFCVIPTLNRKGWKALTAETVVQRIKALKEKYAVHDFYFQEDNFATDIHRFKRICELLVQEKIAISWGTLGIRADTLCRMPDDMIELMYKSGCRNIDVGVESGSPRMLKLMKKDEDVGVFTLANRKLAKYSIVMKYTFVVGYPTETEDDLQMSISLAMRLQEENKNAYTPFFTATVYPGTEFFEFALHNGWKMPKTLEEWAAFDFSDPTRESHFWLTEKQLKQFECLSFTSFFANKNIKTKFGNPLLRAILYLYNPIARFRFRHLFYNFFIEKRLEKILLSAIHVT